MATNSGTIEQADPSQRVESYIRESLTRVEDGERLPSVRQLMRRCKVSKSVVDRALSRLQGEGLIEARSRSGLYRSGGSSIKESMIDYMYFGYPENLEGNDFHSEIFSCLNSILARESKFVRLTVMRREKDPSAVIDRLIRGNAGQVIATSISIGELFHAGRLEQAGIGVLHLLPNFSEPIDASLALNDEAIVRLQIEHLAKLGHRRVAYLHAADDKHYARPINARRDLFSRLSVDYSLQLQPGWIRYTSWKPDRIVHEVRDLLNGSQRPTALVVHDQMVKSVYSAIRSCGLTPGEDVSVIGCDDMPWAAHVDPPLTTVRVSRMKIAETVRNMLRKMTDGEKIGRSFVPPELVIRSSTSWPKAAES